MSTTMKPPPPRRVVTPAASKKRKERGAFDAPEIPKIPKFPVPRPGGSPKPSQPALRNQLLAGYLAHEFLTKGTIFGEKWDPARAEAAPVQAKGKPRLEPTAKAEPSKEAYKRYVEVANLLKSDGAHLPGIVNPIQLCRYLNL